jgi:hypothetical protein
MRAMNHAVDALRRDVAGVVREFLEVALDTRVGDHLSDDLP